MKRKGSKSSVRFQRREAGRRFSETDDDENSGGEREAHVPPLRPSLIGLEGNGVRTCVGAGQQANCKSAESCSRPVSRPPGRVQLWHMAGRADFRAARASADSPPTTS